MAGVAPEILEHLGARRRTRSFRRSAAQHRLTDRTGDIVSGHGLDEDRCQANRAVVGGGSAMLLTDSKNLHVPGRDGRRHEAGTKVKVRETLRMPDPNAHILEWYETGGGKETKTIEITYKRKK